MTHLMQTYSRLPVAFTHGQDVWLWDTHGKRYLDAIAGIAVNTLGHAHPALLNTINEQAKKLIHCSNLYENSLQEKLAEKLCKLSGMEEVFFCNSGCEANEAAIKLARAYGHSRGIESPQIIVMEKAFHGRTLATLSATGNRKVQAGFEPLVTGFVRVPFDDLNAIKQVAANNHNVVAVLLEVIQGEGGINLVSAGYLEALRQICNEHKWLLMLDEVQSGIGRTGKWFAFQNTVATVDVMTLAKGLGSGIPIGACLAAGPAKAVFKPGNHGSTFGGNPLACNAALTTLGVIEHEKLLSHAAQLGLWIQQALQNELKDVKGVKAIRGKGLMIGIELGQPCKEIVKLALDKGLLINVTADTVIRLLPPLIMQENEAKQLVESLVALIKEFLIGLKLEAENKTLV